MGNWVQLTSGGGYDFDRGEIIGRWDFTRDLVHSLGNENRYAGHTARPWSVAIHSVAVARTIRLVAKSDVAALAGLMHDAHESILGDIPTPVAWAIGYERVLAIKNEAQTAIEARMAQDMGWSEAYAQKNHKAVVAAADIAALHVERQILMAPGVREWDYPEPTAEWAQTMYDVVAEIIQRGEYKDGGAAFLKEYVMLDGPE